MPWDRAYAHAEGQGLGRNTSGGHASDIVVVPQPTIRYCYHGSCTNNGRTDAAAMAGHNQNPVEVRETPRGVRPTDRWLKSQVARPSPPFGHPSQHRGARELSDCLSLSLSPPFLHTSIHCASLVSLMELLSCVANLLLFASFTHPTQRDADKPPCIQAPGQQGTHGRATRGSKSMQ